MIHPRYSLGPAPTNRFDATGVFIQESGSGTDGTFGYELFVQEIAPADKSALAIATRTIITWPASLANYGLESSDSMDATDWTTVTNTTAVLDGLNTVIQESSASQKFYRLKRLR